MTRADYLRGSIDRYRGWPGAFVLLLAIYLLWPILYDFRGVRDALGLTPYRDVEVSQVWYEPNSRTIFLSGTMIKERCVWRGMNGYIEAEGGERRRIFVDTSPEAEISPTGDRPPGAQFWGAWVLTVPSDFPPAQTWEVWTYHKCPESDDLQINLFASGKIPTNEGEHDLSRKETISSP